MVRKTNIEESKICCKKCGYNEFRSALLTIPKDKNNKSAGTVDLCVNCYETLKAGLWDGTKCGIVSSYIWQPKSEPIPYEGEVGPICGDCGVKVGELHKKGCDIERCPKCGHQLITCGCE